MLNHYLQIPAAIAGLINVFLAARGSMWNWLFGIITTALYIGIFFSVHLYANMSLFILFFGFQFYGWYQWLYGGKFHTSLKVCRVNKKVCMIALVWFIGLFITISFILKNYTNSTTTHIDAFVTAISLIAQWMLTKKYLENWFIWILNDTVAINMYLMKHLYITAGLYGIFLMLCISGYCKWRKQFYLAKSQQLIFN